MELEDCMETFLHINRTWSKRRKEGHSIGKACRLVGPMNSGKTTQLVNYSLDGHGLLFKCDPSNECLEAAWENTTTIGRRMKDSKQMKVPLIPASLTMDIIGKIVEHFSLDKSPRTVCIDECHFIEGIFAFVCVLRVLGCRVYLSYLPLNFEQKKFPTIKNLDLITVADQREYRSICAVPACRRFSHYDTKVKNLLRESTEGIPDTMAPIVNDSVFESRCLHCLLEERS